MPQAVIPVASPWFSWLLSAVIDVLYARIHAVCCRGPCRRQQRSPPTTTWPGWGPQVATPAPSSCPVLLCFMLTCTPVRGLPQLPVSRGRTLQMTDMHVTLPMRKLLNTWHLVCPVAHIVLCCLSLDCGGHARYCREAKEALAEKQALGLSGDGGEESKEEVEDTNGELLLQTWFQAQRTAP